MSKTACGDFFMVKPAVSLHQRSIAMERQVCMVVEDDYEIIIHESQNGFTPTVIFDNELPSITQNTGPVSTIDEATKTGHQIAWQQLGKRKPAGAG
jgi:hypothetical protein